MNLAAQTEAISVNWICEIEGITLVDGKVKRISKLKKGSTKSCTYLKTQLLQRSSMSPRFTINALSNKPQKDDITALNLF